MSVRLISVTKPVDEGLTAEGLLAYEARVSSPNQDNPSYEELLKYCAEHGHWSVFEMADVTVEITTSRAIAQQILRHRSFSFQEFSQRYATVGAGFKQYEARRQDTKNRQNSIDDMSEEDKLWFLSAQVNVQRQALSYYEEALRKGIAKEQARFLLPLGVSTKLYMKGSIRSFIHYIQVRTDKSTQKEHRDLALAIKSIILEQFPSLTTILGGNDELLQQETKNDHSTTQG
jgi:thymidylate synthase (FAD)